MKRYVIIGNGKMAIDCLKMAVEADIGDLALVVCDSLEETPVSRIAMACAELGIPCRDTTNVNDSALVAEIQAIEPDVIFNINSFKIIREDLLVAAKTGVINFHNGPLPRYGGVNVCSWAILESAASYGVTWMFVSRGVDTGDVVVQSLFDLTGRETAVSLVGRCIKEGIRIFPELLAQIKAGRIDRTPQDRKKATYFSKKDIPYNGLFPFELPIDDLDRYVRAVSFYPMENNFFLPEVHIDGRSLWVGRVALEQRNWPESEVGLIHEISSNALTVACKSGTVAFRNLVDTHGKPVAIPNLVAEHRLEAGKSGVAVPPVPGLPNKG